MIIIYPDWCIRSTIYCMLRRILTLWSHSLVLVNSTCPTCSFISSILSMYVWIVALHTYAPGGPIGLRWNQSSWLFISATISSVFLPNRVRTFLLAWCNAWNLVSSIPVGLTSFIVLTKPLFFSTRSCWPANINSSIFRIKMSGSFATHSISRWQRLDAWTAFVAAFLVALQLART